MVPTLSAPEKNKRFGNYLSNYFRRDALGVGKFVRSSTNDNRGFFA